MTRASAHRLIETLVDPDSWRPWDRPVVDPPVNAGYAAELARARQKTGLDEAVLTGHATIRGRRVAMLLCDFGFLGGSIGVSAGERLAAAIRRATAERLPILALPTSGGTRMQEGATAFLQMVKITAAVVDHKAAHLPYLVYLRDPTTGGVFALLGIVGPRHVRRTRRTGRLPGATGLRSPVRQPIPGGRADLGKSLLVRTDRRGRRRRRTRRHGRPGTDHHRRPDVGNGAPAAQWYPPSMFRPGSRWWRHGDPIVPAYGNCCSTRHQMF